MQKPPQERVLDAVEGEVRTWDELRALTGLSDERLGHALNELFDSRKVWTWEGGGVRVYGVERRRGLVPRFQPPQRRSTDCA